MVCWFVGRIINIYIVLVSIYMKMYRCIFEKLPFRGICITISGQPSLGVVIKISGREYLCAKISLFSVYLFLAEV